MTDFTEQHETLPNELSHSQVHNQEQQNHPFLNNDSAFRPTAMRGNFLPSLKQIHHPNDIITAKLKLLDHNKITDDNFTRLQSDVDTIRTEVESVTALKNENIMIKQHLSQALGKLNRLQVKSEIHHQQTVKLEQFSFSKDIVMYNVKESNPESILDLRNKIYNIFLNNMNIPKAYIFHPTNATGEIRIDNCYRIGKKKTNNTRPVIVTLLTQIGKQVVMDRGYIKNLTKSSTVRITHRYQSEIRERREVQVGTLKSLK